jgi:hypothetical protein
VGRKGLYRHFGRYQLRVSLSATVGALGGAYGSLAGVRAYAASYWTEAPSTVEPGALLSVEQTRTVGPGGVPPLAESVEFRASAPLLGLSYSASVAGYPGSGELALEIVGLKVWRRAFSWLVSWESWSLARNGSTVATGGSGSAINDQWVTHSSIPLVGVLPRVGCFASAEANPKLPVFPPSGLPAYSVAASGTATGGWRFQEPGSGTWVSLPCSVVAKSAPSVGCAVTAPFGSVGGSDCWSMTATSSSEDSYDGTSQTLGGTQSSVVAVPDLAASVGKEGGDYSALVYRFGMPGASHERYASCDTYSSGGPITFTESNLFDSELPVQSELLSRVTGAGHPIEDTLGETVVCPYDITGAKSVNDRLGGVTNVREVRYPKLTGSATMSPYYLHLNFDDAYYLNYWGSRHAMYLYWLPRDDGAGTQWPPGIGGADYWSYLREQWNEHPALPVGERSKTRNCLSSACFDWGGLSEHLYTHVFANSRTSNWGSSRFKSYRPAVPSSFVLTDASAPSWSGEDCTVSVGPSGVTVTGVTGTGKVSLDLGQWASPPYMYWLLCGSLDVGWDPANVSSVTVRLVDPFGRTRVLGTAPGAYTVGAAASERYAGSWAQEYGALALSDFGTDELGTGASASVMADPALVGGFQLFSARSGDKLRFDVVPTDPSEPVLLHFPELFLADTTDPPVWVHETSGQAALLFKNGPAFRWGQYRWHDPLAGLLTVPVVRGADSPSTVTDALCTANAVLEGKDRSDGLAASLSSLFDAGEGMTAASAASLAVAWWIPVEDWPRFALVNTLADHPPMAGFPLLDRDPATLEHTGPDYVLKTHAWDYGTRNHPCRTPDSAPVHLWTPGGVQASSTAPDPVAGWRLSVQSVALTGAEGADWTVRHGGTVYARLRPWHGHFSAVDLGAPSSGGLSYDVSDAFRHVRSRTDAAGVLVATAPNEPCPPIWAESPALTSGVWACVRYGRRRRDQRVWMARESAAGAVALYRSDDDAKTWALASIVGAGSKPTLAALDDGGFLLLRRTGGDLVAVRYDALGTPVGSPFTVASGVDDEGCAAVRLRDGRVAVLYVLSGTVRRAVLPGPSDPPVSSAAVEAGRKPAMAASPTGETVEVWLDGSGKVRARWVGPDGSVTVAAHDAAASGADDQGPAVAVSVGKGGDARAVLLYVASGAVVQLVNRSSSSWA